MLRNSGKNDTAAQLDEPTISNVIRILLCGGYELEKAESKPGFSTLICHKLDDFGSELRYCFIVSKNSLNRTQIEAAKIEAIQYEATPVVIGETEADIVSIEWLRFVNLFGGLVLSISPIEDLFQDNLIKLSFNKLPSGFVGDADDLFEQYVNSALVFILGGPVNLYGQKRRFEERPDGFAIPNDNFCAFYDAKAYSDGYDISINQIRQFSSYVIDFENRYSRYNIPRLNSFIVISGKFTNRKDTLERRSRRFLADHRIPLSFLTSSDLVKMIKLVSENPEARRAIRWSHIFTETIVNPDRVKTELQTIRADRIIKR